MENTEADAPSKLVAFAPCDLHMQVFFEMVEEPSISGLEFVLLLDVKPYWINPLVQYLFDWTTLADRGEAYMIQQ